MSKHIIHKLFEFGASSGAVSLVMSQTNKELIFNYKFADGGEQNFSLPGRLGTKVLASFRQILKISENDLNPKHNFKIKEKKYQLNFKLNIIPDKNGDKIIIQIIKKAEKPLRLRQLGFQRENLKALQKVAKIKSGLVIISAPENQGKSTTLRALLKELDLETRNAYFFENNPKRPIPGINYLPLNDNNWQKIMTQDCDIIIIDDLKSDQNWLKAISAAAAGRLVLVSANAENSLEIILQVLKLKAPLALKIDCLKIISCQRLVNLSPQGQTKKQKTDKNKRTQIAVSETISFNPEIKKYLINEGINYEQEKFWKKLNELIIKNGFKPLNHDLAKKIKTGSVKK